MLQFPKICSKTSAKRRITTSFNYQTQQATDKDGLSPTSNQAPSANSLFMSAHACESKTILPHGTASRETRSHFVTFLTSVRFENARPKFGRPWPITWGPKSAYFLAVLRRHRKLREISSERAELWKKKTDFEITKGLVYVLVLMF